MEIGAYIQGQRLDLFKDETVINNLNVKDISNISKVMADYTQTFNIPASPGNNQILSYWYDSDVDGTFNANLRIEGNIEINSLPYAVGSFQLMDAKVKDGQPYSYSLTFFSACVSLSDKFGDESLRDLDLSDYDHEYSQDIVAAMFDLSINSGDIYYPLISAINEMSIGTTGARDLIDPDNEIDYREFKPALRDMRIIEAIESKYSVTFSRDFFGRAVFYNKFTWLHKDAGYMKAYGIPLLVNITSAGTLGDIDVTVSTVNDTISYLRYGPMGATRQTIFRVTPEAGFEQVPYKVYIYNNGEEVLQKELTGTASVNFADGTADVPNVLKFYVSGSALFEFETRILVRYKAGFALVDKATSTPSQSVNGYLIIKDQVPDLKIKDYINSLIAQFNLVIRPVSENNFMVDTLDHWYDQGKTYDITQLVDTKEVPVERTDVKKRIEFLYQKTDTILGDIYRTNTGTGYGDLKAVYENIAGTDLKIETQFENMLFERLQNENTAEITDIQAGYSIGTDLSPVKGKPISFYRNGYAYAPAGTPLYVSGVSLSKIYHTATEDNIVLGQVTSSLNFGSDLSSYFYSAIEKSLYDIFYSTFIEDLYNSKSRVFTVKCQIPARLLYILQLNDRLVIRDKKYKISTAQIALNDGASTLKIFTDHSGPADSVEALIPITVDSTEYTVDSELLTVDMISIHAPAISYITNGISLEFYSATDAEEFFEVAVTANTNWTVSKIDTGDGVGWVSAFTSGNFRSGYARVKVSRNLTGDDRSVILRFIIGGSDYDLTINQNQ